ncbi:homoserine kinase [Luteipulveratus mongoliensis]|uniref:Homoserine kinase n=1 Tax=Luteipulveratus mongoliensis TaxID=571913 RepID=A0A0K1JLS7_9MICO|nr:homoserine kinase [Luteipulveratus mongoliensis]AKU17535.1 serine kinase [Luteipulveratus mongoliensis]
MSRIVEGSAVAVRVPASAANLGPGFDSIGLALGVWDELEVDVTGSRLVIEAEGEAHAEVPRDPSHLVYRSMLATWHELRVPAPFGLTLRCRNAIPHSRGLGSSASAIVAGVAAAAALAGTDTDTPGGMALINDIASTLEGHPDNASASVYGGLTVSWADDDPNAETRWRTAQLVPHEDLRPVVLLPADRLPTHEARAALPPQVELAAAAANSGRTALLTQALTRSPDLLLPATRDWLHQEQRRSYYPLTMAMVDRLRAAGHAATVSGAGPSVLVLATTHNVQAVTDIVAVHDGWDVLQPEIAASGVRVVSREPRATV